jgi:hypothetical protein
VKNTDQETLMFSETVGTRRASVTPPNRFGLQLGFVALCLGTVGCYGTIADVDDTPTDPCLFTTPISVGQEEGGELMSDDCNDFDGLLTDRWSLTLSEETGVRIDMTSPAFDGAIQLHDNSGVPIAWGYDGPTNARIGAVLPAGSYTILVQSYPPGASGSYVLTVADAPECEARGDLVLGTTVSGTITDNDCWFEWTTVDHWTLDLTSRQKLRVDLKSSDFDEVLLLRDENDFVVWVADWQGPAGHARMETQLEPGEWTVTVANGYPGGSGSYTLTADLAPPCTPGTEVVFGETVSGDISGTDCLFEGWTPADSFALVIADDVPVSLQVKSTDMEPWMFVRDQQGIDIAWGEGDFGTGVSSIRTSLDIGEYSLFVISNSWPPEGSYTLTAGEVACEDPEPIVFGTSVEGSLDADDCLRSGGAYQDRFELVLANDTTVRIDLNASFDTYLILKDSVGDEIEANDDGGSGFDARIERSLSAGTYEIVASSFAEGATGAYTLTVDAPPAPAAAAAAARDVGSRGGPEVKIPSPRESADDILANLRQRYEAQRGLTELWARSIRKYEPNNE